MSHHEEPHGAGWLNREQPAGTEPRNARSPYRIRLAFALFGFVVAGLAVIVLFIVAAGDGGSAELAGALFLTVVALVAAVNAVVVGLRWRNTR
ncbi:hypothetical protein G1H11_15315 [Phytoactinopolyspora alkaliphila]|uniref:Uncharacterized protein n=1 Tax=Phytoactinopolyspora alkaliphila TaxID=1783498 RepID=A0A6N9YPA3_9ACTN|nr:DUF6343 family protein [Phytoactinopolyspora alkaliphila]NED96678.1 hypothetical protein [Phytoactinopolyspora alkaliphila]